MRFVGFLWDQSVLAVIVVETMPYSPHHELVQVETPSRGARTIPAMHCAVLNPKIQKVTRIFNSIDDISNTL